MLSAFAALLLCRLNLSRRLWFSIFVSFPEGRGGGGYRQAPGRGEQIARIIRKPIVSYPPWIRQRSNRVQDKLIRLKPSASFRDFRRIFNFVSELWMSKVFYACSA